MLQTDSRIQYGHATRSVAMRPLYFNLNGKQVNQRQNEIEEVIREQLIVRG